MSATHGGVRSLRVGVNVRPALWPNSGVARVILNLLRTLPPIAPTWSFMFYSAQRPKTGHPLWSIIDINPNCELRLVPSSSTLLFEMVRLPHTLPHDRIDVFLATIPETRLRRSVRTLLTIYDVIPELFPRTSPVRLRLLRATGLVRRNVARCSEVLCLSKHTAEDIQRVYGIAADKVTVAYPGVDPSIYRIDPPTARATVDSRFDIRGRYFLMLHVAEHGSFFQGYSTYVQRESAPLPLVIVCGRQAAAQMRAEVAGLQLSHMVRWLHEVTDAELSALYSSCAAFVYPSLYEGFGLPVLEAIACGALCIAYRVSSLPEIVGSAGLVLDPGDPDGLIDALRAVTVDPDLQLKYEDAINVQARSFQWEIAAYAVRSALERVSRQPPD